MNSFQKSFLVCAFFALSSYIFQVWWAKKKGENLRDIRVLSKIVYRSMPILGISALFITVAPWGVRILVFILWPVFLWIWMTSIKNVRKVAGINENDKIITSVRKLVGINEDGKKD
jgi:hypothetical protein